MSSGNRLDLFDEWAATYDESVEAASGFPFQDYHRVLTTLVEMADARPGMTVLDVGTGTGNLAQRFAGIGCTVTGIDLSPSMLRIARKRVPSAAFLQVDLQDDWAAIAEQRFDIIVSAYVLHEFTLESKIALIARLLQHHVRPDGRLLIADIGFATRVEWKQAHEDLRGVWDEDEHYWRADEALEILAERDLSADYIQVTPYAAVFRLPSRR